MWPPRGGDLQPSTVDNCQLQQYSGIVNECNNPFGLLQVHKWLGDCFVKLMIHTLNSTEMSVELRTDCFFFHQCRFYTQRNLFLSMLQIYNTTHVTKRPASIINKVMTPDAGENKWDTVLQSSCGSEVYNSTGDCNSAKLVVYQIITITVCFPLDWKKKKKK